MSNLTILHNLSPSDSILQLTRQRTNYSAYFTLSFKIKHTDKSKTLNGHLHSGALCRALYSKQNYDVQTSVRGREGEWLCLFSSG